MLTILTAVSCTSGSSQIKIICTKITSTAKSWQVQINRRTVIPSCEFLCCGYCHIYGIATSSGSYPPGQNLRQATRPQSKELKHLLVCTRVCTRHPNGRPHESSTRASQFPRSHAPRISIRYVWYHRYHAKRHVCTVRLELKRDENIIHKSC